MRSCRGKWKSSSWSHEDGETEPLLRNSESKTESTASTSYREVFSSQSSLNLLVYSVLATHSVAYDQLMPVFFHHTIQKDRKSNPDVVLPFKFGGGLGLGVCSPMRDDFVLNDVSIVGLV